jgi:hypothetical protein
MGKVLVVFAVALVLVLALSGVALAAATPQDIYDDFFADGALDGNYTRAELTAYLNSDLLDQYHDSYTLGQLDAIVTRILQDKPGEFPMTGAQMAFIGIGALALVGVGLGLRKVARSRA